MTRRSQKVRLRIQSGTNEVQSTDVLVKLADTFWSRLIGLLNRSSLDCTEGLLLDPCASIHTFGMRFPIDVIFLNREGRVVGYSDGISPNRIRMAPRGACKVLEVAVGNRSKTGIHLDDYLIFD